MAHLTDRIPILSRNCCQVFIWQATNGHNRHQSAWYKLVFVFIAWRKLAFKSQEEMHP